MGCPSFIKILLYMTAAALLIGVCTAEGPFGRDISASSRSLTSETIDIEAIMPPHPTTREDEYLCTSIELPDKPMKLTSVEPLADQSTVHHMLLFGEKKRCLYYNTFYNCTSVLES